ncbi:MAG: heme-binding protein [Burkholderiales bacterium]|nr:heme-binding protein [Burkholderiales bacterium]
MQNIKTIDLAEAKRIAAASEAEAVRNNWNVVIAIVDAGGHLLYLQRQGGTQLGSVDVAIAKAKSALMFKRPTKIWEAMLAEGRIGLLAMPNLLPLEGGLPLIIDDVVVGAIGVSGVKSSEDAQIAVAGAAAW